MTGGKVETTPRWP